MKYRTDNIEYDITRPLGDSNILFRTTVLDFQFTGHCGIRKPISL